MSKPLTMSALKRPCELYKDHGRARPVITEGHHILPVYLQKRVYGMVKNHDLLYVCGTCHENIHAWLYWLLRERKQPEMPVPARARLYAERAFRWYEREKPLT